MPIKELLLVQHCHTDIGYTHAQPILWELQRRFIDQAIEQCEATADWDEDSRLRWTCECTAPLLHWLDHADGRQVERFRSLVAAGQIGAAALPFHFTPLMPAAEIARALAPLESLRRDLGLGLRTAIVHDVNGLPWPTTQALLDAGVGLLISGINQVFGRYPIQRPLAFNWRGSDGRDLPVFNGEHYATFHREFPCHGGSLDEMSDAINHYLAQRLPADYPHDFAYLTVTHSYFVDNNPPDLSIARLVRRWNQEGRTPRIRYVLPDALLDRLEPVRDTLPRYTGDWTDYWNFGCASDSTILRVHRHNRGRLAATELLAATVGPARPDAGDRIDRAAAQAALFEEHTWCASCSITSPHDDRTLEQSHHKAHLAWNSKALLSVAWRDQLEALAGNPREGEGAAGVLFVNATPVDRDVAVRVPRSWLVEAGAAEVVSDEAGAQITGKTARWRHFLSTTYRIDYEAEGLDDADSVLVGPVRVPALGYAKVPLGQLKPAGLQGHVRTERNAIESPYHRLEFEPDTGRVTALIDRTTGRQLLDQNSPWSFFQYVQETVAPEALDMTTPYAGREAFFEYDWTKLRANIPGWRHDWKAQRLGPSRLRGLEVARDDAGVALRLDWDAPGTTMLTQTIRLAADRPAVELQAEFDKDARLEPESIYFAFPLDGAGWRAHFDTADLPVELDAEQLPGVCRDWVTAGNWVCVHTPQQAVTLACPDAPLVQVGGFNFGKAQRTVNRSEPCLLLAWACSNYWMTNFRAMQPGRIRLRWQLGSATSYDPAACHALGAAAAHPVEPHPLLACDTPEARPLITVEPAGVVPLSVRPGLADDQVVVCLANLLDDEVEADITVSPGAAQNKTSRHRMPPRSVREFALS